MGFRFQRRVPTPFGRINLGKRGVSLTEGVPGAHLTAGRRGVRASLGLVGTGFGWFTTVPWSHARRGRRGGVGIVTWALALFALYVLWRMLTAG